MDDPGWTWPAWKFGMKRSDLDGKLQEQYNTIHFSIQDPEAFHHDVYEVSHEASSPDEFHRLLEERKQQRLHELNESLESASLEIISNPALLGTDKWSHAVQLFRTKSLDSLIRYFASYLPHSHPWHRGSSSDSETNSTVDSIAHSSIFDRDDDDQPIMTYEPLSLDTSACSQLPLSPRSMTMVSDSCMSQSETDDVVFVEKDALDSRAPSRTMSFSDSEPERFGHDGSKSQPLVVDDEDDEEEEEEAMSQSQPDSPITDMSDVEEPTKGPVPHDLSPVDTHEQVIEVDEELPSQTPLDSATESETPTPKPDASFIPSFLDAKSVSAIRNRSSSPKMARSPRTHRRDGSPVEIIGGGGSGGAGGWRRSPGVQRIQKSLPGLQRRGRGRVDTACTYKDGCS